MAVLSPIGHPDRWQNPPQVPHRVSRALGAGVFHCRRCSNALSSHWQRSDLRCRSRMPDTCPAPSGGGRGAGRLPRQVRVSTLPLPLRPSPSPRLLRAVPGGSRRRRRTGPSPAPRRRRFYSRSWARGMSDPPRGGALIRIITQSTTNEAMSYKLVLCYAESEMRNAIRNAFVLICYLCSD